MFSSLTVNLEKYLYHMKITHKNKFVKYVNLHKNFFQRMILTIKDYNFIYYSLADLF